MTTTKTSTPPLLVQRDNQWWIEVSLAGGQESILAPVGDGAWLLQQMVEKLVLPRLREPPSPYRLMPSDEPGEIHWTETYASPND